MPLLLSLSLSASSAEPAEPPPPPVETEAEAEDRARQLFENGRVLFVEGEYQAAIEAWTACYELSKRHEMLFNLSNAYEKLGDYPAAIDALTRYRAFLTRDEEREIAARKLRSLEERLAATEAPPPVPAASPAPLPEPIPPIEARRRPWWPVAAIAIGSVGVVTGSILASGSLEARRQAATECVETGGQTLCASSVDPAMRRYTALGTGATVGLSAGVGLLLVGSAGVMIEAHRIVEPSVSVSGSFR